MQFKESCTKDLTWDPDLSVLLLKKETWFFEKYMKEFVELTLVPEH